MKKLLLAIALILAAAPLAEARVIVGGGLVVGAPVYYPYPQAYPYAYYPPAYPPVPTSPPNYQWGDNGQYCREYQHRVLINGEAKEVYGQACRQPDGSWEIVK